MSEKRWTFYDPRSGSNTIGIYHGAESGHVVVYHNFKVVIVDFLIHTTKTYTLLVNDLMLKITVATSSSESGFAYHLDISDTQRDQVTSWTGWFSKIKAAFA
ncbi:MAG: hypothetical protein AAFQ02_01700 [Bacteroidota bacterium]